MKKNKNVVREFKRSVKKVREVQNSLTSEDILCIVAADPNTSGEFLDALSKNPDVGVRAIVANNRYAPTEVLEYLSKDEDVKVRCCVASNPNTLGKALERLSKDKERDVKLGVAHNPSVSRNCLMLLSKQKDTSILIAVVCNFECSHSILRTIFGQSLKGAYDVHDTTRIQSAIAFDSRTPLNILIQLSESKDFCARLNVINNANCPVEILTNLSKNDSMPRVRIMAQHRLEKRKAREKKK